jgi:hypothetical protein
MAASEAKANAARDAFSKELARKGAHAIGVEPGQAHGHAGFVVVAYVPDEFSGSLPESLEVPKELGGGSVPVVLRRQEPFKPE